MEGSLNSWESIGSKINQFLRNPMKTLIQPEMAQKVTRNRKQIYENSRQNIFMAREIFVL